MAMSSVVTLGTHTYTLYFICLETQWTVGKSGVANTFQFYPWRLNELDMYIFKQLQTTYLRLAVPVTAV